MSWMQKRCSHVSFAAVILEIYCCYWGFCVCDWR